MIKLDLQYQLMLVAMLYASQFERKETKLTNELTICEMNKLICKYENN